MENISFNEGRAFSCLNFLASTNQLFSEIDTNFPDSTFCCPSRGFVLNGLFVLLFVLFQFQFYFELTVLPFFVFFYLSIGFALSSMFVLPLAMQTFLVMRGLNPRFILLSFIFFYFFIADIGYLGFSFPRRKEISNSPTTWQSC